LEEGIAFTPRFDADGLIACVTKDASDGQILMLAYMNAEALRLTLETGMAHYWSRSRQTQRWRLPHRPTLLLLPQGRARQR
jgi:phosphoribosyl-AMP cyclohydrolase